MSSASWLAASAVNASLFPLGAASARRRPYRSAEPSEQRARGGAVGGLEVLGAPREDVADERARLVAPSVLREESAQRDRRAELEPRRLPLARELDGAAQGRLGFREPLLPGQQQAMHAMGLRLVPAIVRARSER